MPDQGRVSKVRALLAQANVPDAPMTKPKRGPLGTVRRKFLMQHAKLTAARYSLQAQLDAFVYSAGGEALTSLDLDQLEHLVARLDRMGSNIDAACDPPGAPPAR